MPPNIGGNYNMKEFLNIFAKSSSK